MMRRVAAVILLLVGVVLLAQGASAQTMMLTGAGGGLSSAAAAESYAFIGSASAATSPTTLTFSMTIGTGYVIAGLTETGGSSYTVTINGVSLTQDVAGSGAFIFSGTLSSSATTNNVVITCTGCTFQSRAIFVWLAQNLQQQSVRVTATSGSGSVTIGVTAGYYLFTTQVNTGTTATYNGSTQAPAENLAVASFGNAAEWSIVSTNASFSIVSSQPGNGQGVAATYH